MVAMIWWEKAVAEDRAPRKGDLSDGRTWAKTPVLQKISSQAACRRLFGLGHASGPTIFAAAAGDAPRPFSLFCKAGSANGSRQLVKLSRQPNRRMVRRTRLTRSKRVFRLSARRRRWIWSWS